MLRSINDVNLPKFLSHDLPLFEVGIFPFRSKTKFGILEANPKQCLFISLGYHIRFIPWYQTTQTRLYHTCCGH